MFFALVWSGSENCMLCPIGPPVHGVSEWESTSALEYCSVGFSNCWTSHWFITRIQWTFFSCRYSKWGELLIFYKILFWCGNLIQKYIMTYCIPKGNPFSLSFPAVQIKNCPGPGDRLCCCSTGGPYPTILNGKRNSQDAFVNLVPTTALAKLTIKG